jgi:hypothetical protein
VTACSAVEVVAGRRVAKEVRAMASARDMTVAEFIRLVDSKFEKMLAERVPEQALQYEGDGFAGLLTGDPHGV